MKLKTLTRQFLKYTVVGGIAFVVDFLTLTAIHKLLLQNLACSLYVGVATGFITGSVTNYLLSHRAVFNGMECKARSNLSEFVQYVIIGLTGLGISELGMYFGSELLNLHFGIVKVFVAGIVLIWNFCGRRFFLYE